LLDLVATLLSPTPDIDLDIPPNGLESVLDTDGDGRVDRCCIENGTSPAATGGTCNNGEVPPIDPTQPWTCALSPRMDDGYSIAYTFTAVGATVVGIAP
jgi:hypothetical protein